MEFFLDKPPDTNKIRASVKALNGGFVIVNRSNGEFMQFAGTKNQMTIEVKEKINQLDRHSRIGKNPAIHVWCRLSTTVGIIRLKESELLNWEEAEILLDSFILTKDLDFDVYYKRNISREVK